MSIDNVMADKLEEAADLLEANGVCKGTFVKKREGSPTGYAYCSIGAIRETVPDFYLQRTMETLLAAHVTEKFGNEEGVGRVHIPVWNDHRNRKPSTIIKAFRDTAKRVRAGELVA